MNGDRFTNPYARKATKKTEESRLAPRYRVCKGCIEEDDHLLGLVHSSLCCERCGCTPCHGAIVEVWPKRRADRKSGVRLTAAKGKP